MNSGSAIGIRGVGFLRACLLAELPSRAFLLSCERDARAPSTRDAGNAGVSPACQPREKKPTPLSSPLVAPSTTTVAPAAVCAARIACVAAAEPVGNGVPPRAAALRFSRRVFANSVIAAAVASDRTAVRNLLPTTAWRRRRAKRNHDHHSHAQQQDNSRNEPLRLHRRPPKTNTLAAGIDRRLTSLSEGEQHRQQVGVIDGLVIRRHGKNQIGNRLQRALQWSLGGIHSPKVAMQHTQGLLPNSSRAVIKPITTPRAYIKTGTIRMCTQVHRQTAVALRGV